MRRSGVRIPSAPPRGDHTSLVVHPQKARPSTLNRAFAVPGIIRPSSVRATTGSGTIRAMSAPATRRRPHPRRWVTPAVVGAMAVAVLAVSASARHRELFPAGSAAVGFFDREVTWAQGSTIHHGDQDFDVAPLIVHALRPPRHGVFLRVSDTAAADNQSRWVLFTGRDMLAVPGQVDDVTVAPSGEYAGWIDREGSWRPAGRVAKVVVVDLSTGRTAFETSDGMGGGFGDDLGARYENLEPTFLGFDNQSAYWTNATGSGERWRWRIGSSATNRAEDANPDGEASTTPRGGPWDPQRGRPVWINEGRPVSEPTPTGERGVVSPDGRFVIAEPVARLAVTRAADGHRAALTLDRFAWFGGWRDDDHFYALTRPRYEGSFDPSEPDRTTGTLVACELPTGDCAALHE